MKGRIGIALAVVAGFGLGASSIHVLHAQAKPPVYTVVEIDLSNREAYEKDYAPKAQDIIRAKGGKIIAASSNVTTLEGSPAKRVAIHQWESMEKAKGWLASSEYKENRKIGDKYAKFRVLALEGAR